MDRFRTDVRFLHDSGHVGYSTIVTLTEALTRGQLVLVLVGKNGSNARTLPYEETYRLSSADRETPIEHLQKAVEESET